MPQPLEDANSSFKLTIGEERIIVSVDSPQLAEQWMLTLEEAVEEANHSDRVDKLVSAMGGVSAGHEAHRLVGMDVWWNKKAVSFPLSHSLFHLFFSCRSSSNQDSLSAALKREDAKIVTTNERLKTLRLAGRPDMFRVYSGWRRECVRVCLAVHRFSMLIAPPSPSLPRPGGLCATSTRAAQGQAA